MSAVSDESAGGTQKPKRVVIFGRDWRSIRTQYETTDATQSDLAALLNVPLSSLQKRCWKEKWRKVANVVDLAKKQVGATFDEKLQRAVELRAELVATNAAERIVDELQPMIEREKREQILRSLRRAKKAQNRLDSVAEGWKILDKEGEPIEIKPGPKEEMQLATAEEKYDSIIRRNLGMGDTNALPGVLNLNILSNQAAVSITSPA